MNPTPSSALRLGLAGLSHDHIEIVGQLSPSDFEIVGAQDPDDAVRGIVAHRFSLPAGRMHADLEAMLEASRPDAVAAFGSIRDHLAVVEACAPRGIHVMVEKPLAIGPGPAGRMAELARRHGIHLLTNYETTWYASNAEALGLVGRGHLGAVRKVLVSDGHFGPIEAGCQPQFLRWLTDPAQSGGGALSDFGCYGANLMTFMMGGRLPRSVTAVTHSFKPDLYGTLDDDALIVLDYGDAEAVVQASWNWPFARKDMEVYGTAGLVVAVDGETVVLRTAADAAERRYAAPALPRSRSEPFANFAALIRGTEVLAPHDLSALDNNLAVVRILDAARRSALARSTVPLADAESDGAMVRAV